MRPYAYSLAEKYRWIQMVQSDSTLSIKARRVLEVVPKCIELDSTSPEAAFDFKGLASKSLDLEPEDVEEVWPEVLASGYIERRYEPAKWVVAMKFPDRA